MNDVTTPQPMPTASTAPAKRPSTPRVAPIVGAVGTVELPTPTRSGGVESAYPFASLEVGQSFGVKNKDKAAISSSISAQNRKHKKELTDDAGNVTTAQTKHFVAVEIDAALAKTLKGTHLEGFKVAVKRDI